MINIVIVLVNKKLYSSEIKNGKCGTTWSEFDSDYELSTFSLVFSEMTNNSSTEKCRFILDSEDDMFYKLTSGELKNIVEEIIKLENLETA